MNPEITITQLAEGFTLWQTVEAAKTAQRNSYLFPRAAEQLAADPKPAAILAAFGMRLLPANVREKDRIYQIPIWQTALPFGSFWEDFTTQTGALLTTTATADQQVLQRLEADAAWTIWQELRATLWTAAAQAIYGARATVPPTDDQFPLHLAALLASLGGIAWHVADDGTTLVRTLRNQPLRLVPTNHHTPPNGETKTKLLFPCVGWAILPANSAHNAEDTPALVYLSAVGPQKKLKAVWAATVDSKRSPLALPHGKDYLSARRPKGSQVLDTFWNEDPLPDSGLAHLAMHHRSMLHPRSGQPFLHLTGEDGLPDLALFQQQLDAAATFPIQPRWTSALWDAAFDAELIIRLPCYGCAAYWVTVANDTAWGDLIARCAGATTSTTLTYGTVSTATLDAPMLDDAD